MEIRKIKPEERILASKIQSVAFLASNDFSTAETNPEQFRKNYETIRAVFDEGKMCACLALLPYEFRFDGHTVKTAGIGGVASLPEERRNGNVRRLLYSCFEEMRENGQVYSYLYPFSHPYYRKFGYEFCLTQYKTTIPLTSFSHFPLTGKVRFHLPEDDGSEVKNIYSRFIQDKNLAMVRSDQRWSGILEKDPYKTNQYLYVWYNSRGEARSYIIFQAKPMENKHSDMHVEELIWLDSESLHGILGFINQFHPRYENFLWKAPTFLDLALLFPEPYPVKREVILRGMNRIVDVEKALELVKYPEGSGQLAFKITDDFLQWNNGTYVVTWEPSGVEVVKREKEPDLACSIQVLTQLLTGYAGLEDLNCRDDVKIYGNQALLASVCKRRTLFLNDYF